MLPPHPYKVLIWKCCLSGVQNPLAGRLPSLLPLCRLLGVPVTLWLWTRSMDQGQRQEMADLSILDILFLVSGR